MALTLLPDAVAVLTGFLREQSEVTELVGDRVYSVLPQKPTWPAVRIVQWTESQEVTRPLWLVTAGCQVDVWAKRKSEASLAARTVRAVLAARLVDERSGLVSGVAFGTMADTPDTDYEPALNRYRFDVFVTIHPEQVVPARVSPAPDVPVPSEP